MKCTGLVIATLLAVASVEGAAFAIPDPEANNRHAGCKRGSESCSSLKRAAEAAAEAIPQTCHGACYRAGEVCSKARRDALALAEATAEAFAAADPDARPCYAPGAPCSIAVREATPGCGGGENGPSTPQAPDGKFCYRAGQVCPKLKRAAEAVAVAIGQLNQDPEAVSGSWNGTYWATGEPNSNQKRAIDDINSLLDKILLR